MHSKTQSVELFNKLSILQDTYNKSIHFGKYEQCIIYLKKFEYKHD